MRAIGETLAALLRDRDPPLRCAFCDKTRREVQALIAAEGRTVAICNECVSLAVRLIEERSSGR